MDAFSFSGCQILEPISQALGFPIDQVNFVACQLAAIVLSFAYRCLIPARRVGASVRHVIALVFGIAFGFFCFGRQMYHVFAQAGSCYLFLRIAPPKVMHGCVFVIALTYLSLVHVMRAIHNYGGYTLDITGPLMISTQKMVSLALSLHDGTQKRDSDLTEGQREHAVRKMPGLLEYCSYIFYFHGFLVGPQTFFNEYATFVDGSHLQQHAQRRSKVARQQAQDPAPDDAPVQRPSPHGSQTAVQEEPASKVGSQTAVQEEPASKVNSAASVRNSPSSLESIIELQEEPSPLVEVMKNLLVAAFALFIITFAIPRWPKVKNADPEFIWRTSFPKRIAFLLLSVGVARWKYYFAWTLLDAITNASGLGFDGFDENGKAKWNRFMSVNIVKLETATSLKMLLANWNMRTAVWLRSVCYERIPFQPTVMTFALSALWHGLYPGYYFTFLSGAVGIMAARLVRRRVRPHFLTPPLLKGAYDVATWFASQLTLAYSIVPFTLLEFKATFFFYHHSMYWFLHIIMAFILFLVPSLLRAPKTD